MQGLIGLIHSLWIVAKGTVTTATMIAMHLNTTVSMVADWLAHRAPPLKDFSLAIATFFRANFALMLDIWQT
jgi:hypothetical protein